MKKLIYLFLSFAILGFSSCDDDDDKVTLRKISVNFASESLGIDEDKTSVDVSVNLSRVSTSSVDVSIALQSIDVVYGTDFTTNPAPENNTIKLTIPAGKTSASFNVSKMEDVLFEGSESIKFTITEISTAEDAIIGDKKESILTFGAIISEGQQLTLEGKTVDSNYGNSVYVDFSSNTQYPINRQDWTLGFYCGEDFRVILSSGNSATATSTGKININDVTLADAETATINIGAAGMQETLDASTIDNPNGSLSGTVFKAVSASENENQVYFVAGSKDKAADRKSWYKVKVNRKGEGYTVQYARVTESTIKTIDISKDASYNIKCLDLEAGTVVDKEPKAAQWDIMWGINAGISIMTSGPVAAFMQDNVLINNLGGVKVAKVSVPQGGNIISEFNNFSVSGISALEFSSDRSAIGTGWREVAGMGANAGVLSTHFYVVKDTAGNHYKLRFVKFGVSNDGAERGRPVIEYKLVK